MWDVAKLPASSRQYMGNALLSAITLKRSVASKEGQEEVESPFLSSPNKGRIVVAHLAREITDVESISNTCTAESPGDSQPIGR